MAISKVIAKVAGETLQMTYNPQNGLYEATYVPKRTSFKEPDRKFIVSIEATNELGKTASISGDTAPGLSLQVHESDPPEIILVSPQEGYLTSSNQVFILKITEPPEGSGVDPAFLTASLDGKAITSSKTEVVEGGFEVSYTSTLLEGPHSLVITARDNDGNTASRTFDFTVDTTPPILEAYLDIDRVLTDRSEVVASVLYTETISAPVDVLVEANGDTIKGVGGKYTIPLIIGENEILVSATNQAGLLSEKRFRVIRLIKDRTVEDVKAHTEKGVYNATDLNRVQLATRYLAEKIADYGYLVEYTDPEKNWTVQDAPTVAQMSLYLKNVAALRDAFPGILFAGAVPLSMKNLTYTGANGIEELLLVIEGFLVRVYRSPWICNEIFCGEE